MSVESCDVEYLRKNMGLFIEYVKNKRDTMPSPTKWKYGLIGGSILYIAAKFVYKKWYRWYNQLPPGPDSIIPFGDELYKSMYPNKWHVHCALLYGQVFSIYEFNQLHIIINDSNIAKQLLSKSNTLDRDFSEIFFKDQTLEISARNMITMNGEIWSKIRQLYHTQIVRVMQTKYVNRIMTNVIKSDLEPELNKIASSSDNNLWFSRRSLSQLTFNIIFRSNFGRNAGFKHNKLCTQLAKDLVDVISWDIIKRRIVKMTFPLISKYIIPKSYFKKLNDCRQRINDGIKYMVRERNEQNKKGNADDMSFMDHIQQLTDRQDIDYYNERTQISDIFLMFLAGTDTTSVSVEWGLLLLSRQQDIQEKVRNELINAMKANNIDYRDCSNIVYDIELLLQLPLFRACIHEILRISCVARTGVQHCISKHDIWITTDDGKTYRLPKGATLKYNVECMHYDYLKVEKNWKNREYNLGFQQICLANWIKDDTRKFYQNESFMTFGYGKRDCVGKQLAMKEMRVMLGYLLLNYRFKVEKKYEEMKSIPCVGGVRGGVSKPPQEIPVLIEKI